MASIFLNKKKSKKCSLSCEYREIDNVLHIVYTDIIPEEIIKIADIYEGKIDNRIGINFPMEIVEKYKGENEIKKNNYNNSCEYVIVYKKGDKITKEHELMHAKYYMDKNYKEKIINIWREMEDKNKDKVKKMLKKMGYPDDENILIDEFQAYYYTEKSNFFGKF
jgi:hypothetical protein